MFRIRQRRFVGDKIGRFFWKNYCHEWFEGIWERETEKFSWNGIVPSLYVCPEANIAPGVTNIIEWALKTFSSYIFRMNPNLVKISGRMDSVYLHRNLAAAKWAQESNLIKLETDLMFEFQWTYFKITHRENYHTLWKDDVDFIITVNGKYHEHIWNSHQTDFQANMTKKFSIFINFARTNFSTKNPIQMITTKSRKKQSVNTKQNQT